MNFLKIKKWYRETKASWHTRLIRSSFGEIAEGCRICPPFHTNDPSEIYIGRNSCINAGGWLDCVKQYGNVKYSPRLEIGENAYIGHRVHIIACGHMRLGNNIVLADGVYITDNIHGYQNVEMPIMPQPLTYPGPVTIEDEVWLGEGVCVMPNVTIGKHSVIGANAVVTKNIPAYSIAVGIPAKVIKQYNFENKKWDRVDVDQEVLSEQN